MICPNLQNLLKNSSSVISRERSRISTGNKSLDVNLNGGIPLGKLIELIGNSGSGKTQMCMTLCLNVQLPRTSGGLEGESLFIDTRRDFNPRRIRELSCAVEQQCTAEGVSKVLKSYQMLSNVHYVQCTTVSHLIAQLRMISKYLTTNRNIKLIVVDSLSFSLGMLQSVNQRYEILHELYMSMREVLYQHQEQVALVVTNVFTNCYKKKNKKYCRVTALGRMHSILVNERIWFTKEGKFFVGKWEKTRRY